MEEKDINIWIKIADEDLDAAEYCVNGKKYLWAMVMCQQAVEKVLKAIYVKNTDKIPEKTHNLIKLAKDTGILDELSGETFKLLNKLLIYYFATRYPDKRVKLQSEFTKNNISNILNQTKEVYLWLKNKL